MRIVFLALLGVLAVPMAGQTFMRAYSQAPFTQPGLILPEDAIGMSDGTWVFTAFDGYLVHTNAAGEPLRTFSVTDAGGGALASVNLDYLAQAGPNQLYVAGNTSSDTLFILKLSLDGTIIWQRSYRTPDNYPRAIRTMPDGGLIVLAITARGTSQSSIPVLTRIDASGNLVWQRRYYNANPANGRMNWYDLNLAANGDLLVTGTTTPAAPQRVIAARISPTGAVLWAKEWNASNNNNEFGRTIAELANGQIKVLVNNPVPGTQFGTVRLSAAGDLISSTAYSGGGANVTRAHIQASGRITGALTNLSVVFGLAPDGTPAFAHTYDLQNGSSLLLNTMFPTSDGGLMTFGGYTYSFFGDFACVLLKTSADGLLPPGYSTPLTLTQVGYTPTLSTVPLGDSTFGALNAGLINVASAAVVYDTLLGTPPLALDPVVAPLFHLGPNPATETLRLTYDGGTGATWRILDLSGRILKTGVILPGQQEVLLPVTALASGRYLCEVLAEGHRQGMVFIKP
ncbi:MAG: hypothetical protein SF053_08135 [Bacteroidia bacterium]|nr:hypothetical protein [Bacteroidia bacterium]